MSDFHAIGGMSSTLQTLLLDRMELPDGILSVPVTVGPPPFSARDVDPHREDPRVNLFCYRVTENGFLQNQEIPGRGSSGYGHPPLSLNLHYLVTAYGNVELPTVPPTFDDTNAQFLLGSAMRVLHDVPVVTDNLTTVQPPSGAPILHPSLRDEFEHVKTTLEPLTLEDVTKVWTALALRMRLAAAYVVNVVQIESRRRRRFARPVGQPASAFIPPFPADAPAPGPLVAVLTIQTPTITDVRVRRAGSAVEQPFPYARVLDTLVLRGTSLAGPVTSVSFGDVVVPATVALADRVEADVPDAATAAGPIPPEQQLQPGVRTARIVVRNPLVPGSTFTSNEVPFMLVPFVNPATVVYGAGPPRTITFAGTRLLGGHDGGQTMIGRSAVARAQYVSGSPTALVVPVPDTLPTRGVHTLIGLALPPGPVPLGPLAQTLTITIGGTTHSRTANLTSPVPRAAVAAAIESLIHDAAPNDPRFAGARVDLWADSHLVVVPGGLTDPISIVSPAGLTFANDLGLLAAQPPGVNSALVSGELDSPPPITGPTPRVRLTIGAQPPIDVPVAPATSLADLASDLQTAINGIGGAPEYLNALVMTTHRQLLVVPGLPGVVRFDATPADDATVTQLQLHARFAVRVRVSGAESLDPAVVELPQ